MITQSSVRYGIGGWVVLDYDRRQGKGPTVIAGPYRTRLEAEVAARKAARKEGTDL